MAKGQRPVASNKSAVVAALPRACQDETAAVDFFEGQRWGSQPRCAHCDSADVYQMRDRATGERNRRYLWRCKACNKQYTVRVNTVYEDSPIPLKVWAYAFWAACSSKKGVSALQIKRQTGVTYKSALYLMHRIRLAMDEFATIELAGNELSGFDGIIEADETYVGGKEKNKHLGQRNPRNLGGKGKTAVFSMVQREGKMRSVVMDRVTLNNLRTALVENVSPQARVITDSLNLYGFVTDPFASHETVDHTKEEYVRGDVHTNTVESSFSLLKRGIYGTFHNISKRHLHRYCAEFDFRWNTRRMDDGARTVQAIRSATGKRLTYRQPSSPSQ
jgi:transposase-like protein